MRKHFAFITSVLVAAVAALGLASSASAAGETASTSFTIKPNSGPLYQGGSVPASWELKVAIRKQYEAGNVDTHKVLPLKNVLVKVPTDLTFHPNNNKTPICPDSAVGPNANLAVPPPAVLSRCPNSLIGNGHADLYLAKQNMPVVPPPPNTPQWIDDASLLVFNGGLEGGNPVLKIYGYSYKTNYGVYIHAVLQPDGTLDVRVPWLSQDSAVANFNLNLPGNPYTFENAFGENVTIPGGKDRDYARAKCSTGTWDLTSSFLLGQRDNVTKEPYGEELTITAPTATETCVGKPGNPPAGGGKARFARVVAKGPKRMRRAGKGVFRVRVKNNGNAVARGIRIVVNGKWVRKRVQRVGQIAPGKARTVRVRVNLTRKAKRRKATVVKFRVAAQKTAAKVGKARVRVR